MPLNSIRQGIRNRPCPIREQTPAEYEEAKRLHVTYQAALDEQSNRIKQVIKEGDNNETR
jgi:hypothetical protein